MRYFVAALELLAATVAAVVVGTLAASVARAAPGCMTMQQARVAHPGSHLYWHTRDHCWNTTPAASSADRDARPRRLHYVAYRALSSVEGTRSEEVMPRAAPLNPPHVIDLFEERWPVEDAWPLLARVLARVTVAAATRIYEAGEFNEMDAQAGPPPVATAAAVTAAVYSQHVEVSRLLVPALFVALLVGVFWTAPKVDMALDVWGFTA